ncbi:putative tRNA wybutosine-synthesizing protein [Tribonema minus]|uniref:tRNA 4-demethylwyosine synthase (AdoMet-dependent) n=1 Tax=Tribonema minus TaxID=303371 RepID=A0A836CDS3_9STRA|nr:putative tRNA wybutosine-synthesizing protein [Tribonema minus]
MVSQRVATAAALSTTAALCVAVLVVYSSRKNTRAIRDISDIDKQRTPKAAGGGVVVPVTILYGSLTGTAASLADTLCKDVFALNVAGFAFHPRTVNMASYEPDDLETESVVVFILSTFTDGAAPPTAVNMCRWLEEASVDFRVSKAQLQQLSTAVFGLGSSAYSADHFCTPARSVMRALDGLGATAMLDMGEGDDAGDLQAQFKTWTQELLAQLCTLHADLAQQTVNEDIINDEYLLDEAGSNVLDLEDLGTTMKSAKAEAQGREMVTPLQRKALTKEGYKIIGSHSAVKLCRWTKAQLRGRGGCYKHTFYGITSYQCMEATPSLACANKCVFCWRHHKNPVGREWRWKVDDPLMIVEEAVTRHQAMINEMKGVPGVKLERWKEAFTVAHCALSLVGEPIMYPHINELVAELHRRRISTFLVTNAQFPECIEALVPVTQLYVSIDAATKDTLKAVDRPLFSDFWERFLGSLRALRKRGQRTVYRLTLVKGWNMAEVQNYAELIAIGAPELIEIKAVTYCGTSDASTLTMSNVPWHEEVRAFGEALAEATGGSYGLATEHKHSCCLLLANRDKYFKGGRFHMLADAHARDGKQFSSADYMAETPAWAIYDAPEAGFDPVELRHYRNGKGPGADVPKYEPSESGCG